jgi:thiamine biosynthesis lipoprotein
MVLSDQASLRDRVRQSATIRDQDGVSTLTFFAMGTRCRVLFAEPAGDKVRACGEQVLDWVADFEATYSRFLEGSLISRINQAAGKNWVEVDEETDRLFDLCQSLFFFTRGVFDPTSLPLIRLWDWKKAVLPDDQAIAAAREVVGWNKVQRRRGEIFLPLAGMALDLGGIGKEYAVDRAALLAARHGIQNVLVDFGQDIRAHGKPPGRPAWHVGLENPRQPGTCWASVAVTDHAVATSGDYLRHFVHQQRRYGHIIDPRTGHPVANPCQAVSVVAPVCSVAGILTTTAFILGPQEGFHLIHSYLGASGAIVTETTNLITPRFYDHLVQQN